MSSLTPVEESAYKLLFDDKLSAVAASKRLKEQGLNMSPMQLRNFKESLFERIMEDEKKERLCEMMLDSYDRTKIEFEILVQKLKKMLEKYEAEGDTFKQGYVLSQLKDLIELALKNQGRIGKGILSIQAKNVNILNPSDLSQAFKRIQDTQFQEMDAEYSNGKLVFNAPTPELIDDFNKWRALQLRSAVKAEVNGPGTDN